MSATDSLILQLEPFKKERLAALAGPLDENFKQLERRLGVSIAYSGDKVSITGSAAALKQCSTILKELYLNTAATAPELRHGGGAIRDISPEQVHLSITEHSHVEQDESAYPHAAAAQERGSVDSLYVKAGTFKTKRGYVKARTPHQADYIAAINAHDVCFGIGPAGTGKTYLAVAAAVDALERNAVRRIVLTRPAVEAGEKLGFLPGDLTQKVDPYLRPLYDALFEMLGFEKTEKLIERSVIEIAPLAYMRGRTLNDAFVILDEAQNTTVEQMKMFLTRIGFNSKAVITGDPSQVDLPRAVRSGLKHALEVLSGLTELGFATLDAEDVVRHPVVAAIVRAYADYERRSVPVGVSSSEGQDLSRLRAGRSAPRGVKKVTAEEPAPPSDSAKTAHPESADKRTEREESRP